MKKRYFSPTYAEIILYAIRYNLEQVRALVGSGSKILAVVKANAYGHGILEVTKTLLKAGVDYLGVASLDEALVLRKNNIRIPILVLGTILPQDSDVCLEYALTQTVCTKELAASLNLAAKRRNKKAKVHIKVDTGMGRLGVWHNEADGFIKELSSFKNLDLEGLYTHLSSAESDEEFTRHQIDSFTSLVERAKKKRIEFPFIHIANSAGIIGFGGSCLNLVRPGLMLYGIAPVRGNPPPVAGTSNGVNPQSTVSLIPALSLKTKATFLKCVSKGRRISYGKTHTTPKPTMVATIPAGYADGYPRSLSNKSYVLIKGKCAPVIGRVCMDHTMVDVGDIDHPQIGDEVVLIGRQGKLEIKVEELADIAGTIAYEILVNIPERLTRIYIGNER